MKEQGQVQEPVKDPRDCIAAACRELPDDFEAALREAAEFGAEMNEGARGPATRATSSSQIVVRKPTKAEFFWPVWWRDLEVLEGKDENGNEVYALLNPQSPDAEVIRVKLKPHFKRKRFIYVVSTTGSRFLIPTAKFDNGYFKACREFTETTMKTAVGPFKRVADLAVGQHFYLEALSPKAFKGGPEHQDQTTILKAAFPVINSKDDAMVRRLLGLEY